MPTQLDSSWYCGIMSRLIVGHRAHPSCQVGPSFAFTNSTIFTTVNYRKRPETLFFGTLFFPYIYPQFSISPPSTKHQLHYLHMRSKASRLKSDDSPIISPRCPCGPVRTSWTKRHSKFRTYPRSVFEFIHEELS